MWLGRPSEIARFNNAESFLCVRFPYLPRGCSHLIVVLWFSTVYMALWEEWRKEDAALDVVNYFILSKRVDKLTNIFSNVAFLELFFFSVISSRCLWNWLDGKTWTKPGPLGGCKCCSLQAVFSQILQQRSGYDPQQCHCWQGKHYLRVGKFCSSACGSSFKRCTSPL